MRIAVILAAAGCGSRMGASVNKVLLPLAGRPILCHSLQLFQSCPQVSRIVVTVSPADEESIGQLIQPYDKARLCRGGATRIESVALALSALAQEAAQNAASPLVQPEKKATWDKVAVHDGARPLLSLRDWQRLLDAAEQRPAALLVRPVTDTIKLTQDELVLSTIPRQQLAAALTPQIFDFSLLLTAYQQAQSQGYTATDDAELVEKLGYQPLALPALDPNPKITYREDLLLAEAILSASASSAPSAASAAAQAADVAAESIGKKAMKENS